MLEETPCARAGGPGLTLSHQQALQGLIRLAGLVFEEISHSRAMKVRLCVAESVFTVQGLAWVARIL